MQGSTFGPSTEIPLLTTLKALYVQLLKTDFQEINEKL